MTSMLVRRGCGIARESSTSVEDTCVWRRMVIDFRMMRRPELVQDDAIFDTHRPDRDSVRSPPRCHFR